VAVQYLKTKLDIPTSRKLKLPRPKLLQLLGDSAINKTILVSAPAGYGKTSMVIEWTKSRKEPFAWISLDENDNDPIRFYGYLREALKRVIPDLEHQENYLTSYHSLSISVMMTSLVNALADSNQSLFVVLDDYHTINNPEIHEMTSFLIQHATAGINVIISTRLDPPLSLERWRVQGELLEVRQEDLCFSKDDVSVLLNKILKLEMSDGDIAAITQKTEGWIAGLQIAALFLADRDDKSKSISEFTGSHTHIMTYLVKEVILRQPEDIRTFLQETSILDELSEHLCNFVTKREDSRELLNSLSLNNQFIIQLDNHQQRFRYHHLFSDALKNLLKQQTPGRMSELYLRASQWYEENGWLDEAIKHAFGADDQLRAINLIEQYASIALADGERRTFRKWLDLLPEETVRERPILNLIHAWAIMNDKTRAADELFESRLDTAEQLVERMPAGADQGGLKKTMSISRLKDTVTLLRAIFAFERGRPSRLFLPGLKKQLDQSSIRLRSTMLYLMAHIQMRAMELDNALLLLDDAVSLAKSENYIYLATYATYLKAWILFQNGKLHQAIQVCREGQKSLVLTRKGSEDGLPISSAFAIIIAAVLYEWNQADEAEDLLDKAMVVLKKTTEIGIIIHGITWQIRIKSFLERDPGTIKSAITELTMMERYHQGISDLTRAMQLNLSNQAGNPPLDIQNPEKVTELLNVDREYFKKELSYYQNFNWLLASRLTRIQLYLKHCYHVGDKPAEKIGEQLLAFLETQLSGTNKWGLKRWSIELLITRAMVHELLDDRNAGVKTLEKALDLAAPEGAVRVFLENAAYLKHLLALISEQGRFRDFIGKIVSDSTTSGSEGKGDQRGAPLNNTDLLSSREQEVLRLIAEGYSNQDISNELFISLNTVKTHVAHVYEKLGVNRRTKAVSRAKQLGFL
jgi:ATP/maltotriose-dependent transcriptional regulator MalT